MPSSVIKSIAKKSSKGIDTIEDYWDEAKDVVKDQYSDVQVDSDRYYALVTSIVKRMAGVEDKKVESVTSKLIMNESKIREALNSTIKNPFTEKAGVMFINSDMFTKAIEVITDSEVEQIKRNDDKSFYILLDTNRGDKSKDIDSVQFLYGNYEKNKPIYLTKKEKRGVYQLEFNQRVIIK